MTLATEQTDRAAARLGIAVDVLRTARTSGELKLAADPDHVVIDEAIVWAEARFLRRASIEHVDDAAARLGIAAARIRAANDAGELRHKVALSDFVSIAAVNVWAHGRGIAVSSPPEPVRSSSATIAITRPAPPAPPLSSSPPAPSGPAIDPALRAEYERTAKALGLSVDDVIANARTSDRPAGRRTVAHAHRTEPAPTSDAPSTAPAPARAFVEYEAPARSGMTRKDPARPLEASATEPTPSATSEPGRDASDVAGNVPPLVGGRRRAMIDYPNKIGAPT